MFSARNPLTCGFLKVKVFNLLVKDAYELRGETSVHAIADIHKKHCADIKEFFGMAAYDFTLQSYTSNLLSANEVFRTLTRNKPKSKSIIMDTFSEESWKKLAITKKEKHSPGDCKGCHENRKFKNAMCHFPIKGNTYKSLAKKHGLITRKPLWDITNVASEKKMVEKIQRDTVKAIEKVKKRSAIVRLGYPSCIV